MRHTMRVCKCCREIVTQCRCAAKDKDVIYVVCLKCTDHKTPCQPQGAA